jgi:hypothetical protein
MTASEKTKLLGIAGTKRRRLVGILVRGVTPNPKRDRFAKTIAMLQADQFILLFLK